MSPMAQTLALIIVSSMVAIALSALLISMAALSQTRSIWRRIAMHEKEDLDAHGELFQQLRTCNRACQNVLRDIVQGVARIEGWIEAQDPDFAKRRAAALKIAQKDAPAAHESNPSDD